MTVDPLEVQQYVEETAFGVVNIAPTPAALALCTGVIPDYLDACLRVDFMQAARARYAVLTEPGRPDGPE